VAVMRRMSMMDGVVTKHALIIVVNPTCENTLVVT
jgi:hypothetical protein